VELVPKGQLVALIALICSDYLKELGSGLI